MHSHQKRKIHHVAILANTHKEETECLVREMAIYLEEKAITYEVMFTSTFDEVTNVSEITDLAIILGGDGTVLSCARFLHSRGIPMLAVNLGSFGFITEIGKDEWKEAFELWEKGKAKVSRRLMVRVSVQRDNQRVFHSHGLNEVTISSSGISKMVLLQLYINETNGGLFRSDGVIVATPTGSTGYSLAAGGPILDVDLDALIINPICAFTLSNRPLVVTGDDVVRIVASEKQKTELSLTVDGQVLFPLVEGDEIIIEKSHSKALLIESTKRNYYEVIRDKLNWSGGMHA